MKSARGGMLSVIIEILTGNKVGGASPRPARMAAPVVTSAQPDDEQIEAALVELAPAIDKRDVAQFTEEAALEAASEDGAADVEQEVSATTETSDPAVLQNNEWSTFLAKIDVFGDAISTLGQTMAAMDTRLEAQMAASNVEKEQMELIKGYAQKIRELEDDAVFRNVVRPVLEDLFLLHDHIMARRKTATQDLAEALEAIDADLIDVLARHGVQPVPHTTTLDLKKHKVVKTVWSEPCRDLEIVEVSRDGFVRSGEVVRPPEVVVRRLKQ